LATFSVVDHLSVESEFLVKDGLIIGRAHSFLSANTVPIVDGFPLDKITAGKLDNDVGLLYQRLKLAHLHHD
jgi:hypothetical protein